MPLSLSSRLTAEFEDAFGWTERLFACLSQDALYTRPIPLRQPCIFYLGHLPAFAWNQIFRCMLKRSPFNEHFDSLFERGIDPPVELDMFNNYRLEKEYGWPAEDAVLAYKEVIETELLGLVRSVEFNFPDSRDRLFQALNVALEHYWMHVETFMYMLHQLPLEYIDVGALSQPRRPDYAAHAPRLQLGENNDAPRLQLDDAWTAIPEGDATIGAALGELPFGWCNEFGKQSVRVPSFEISVYPVTNGQFAEFVEAGGYQDSLWWNSEDWGWIQGHDRHHPQFWFKDGGRWFCRRLLDIVPLQEREPAYVCLAEAQAYARFKGARIPSEAQFHRAAFGTESGEERQFPWGEGEAPEKRANLGLVDLNPRPVGSSPEGVSFFGVHELVGNGWEWTSTPFYPLPGFQPLPSYPGYSRDFFDGDHFIMKGASPSTSTRLVRRTFRNWFRRQYPYAYAKFRLVRSGHGAL